VPYGELSPEQRAASRLLVKTVIEAVATVMTEEEKKSR
jgi:hypothetical protein